jgi:hypothetical protein
MKKNEVPQDDENVLEGKMKGMINYAVDEKGNYVQVQSSGWEPENVALKLAWEDVEKRIAHAKEKLQNGEVSPVYYFMEKSLMDLNILAAYVGKWQWQIKRHFNPKIFKNLNQRTKEKYAAAFNISVDQLLNPLL